MPNQPSKISILLFLKRFYAYLLGRFSKVDASWKVLCLAVRRDPVLWPLPSSLQALCPARCCSSGRNGSDSTACHLRCVLEAVCGFTDGFDMTISADHACFTCAAPLPLAIKKRRENRPFSCSRPTAVSVSRPTCRRRRFELLRSFCGAATPVSLAHRILIVVLSLPTTDARTCTAQSKHSISRH